MVKKIKIFDEYIENLSPNKNEVFIFWKGFTNNKQKISASFLLNEYQEKIKDEYLLWVNNLTKKKIKDKLLVDFFKIGSGLSYWHLTKISEKPSMISDGIFNVFKARAIEIYLINNNIKKIEYHSINYELKLIIKKLSKLLDLEFIDKSYTSFGGAAVHRSIFKIFFNFAKSIYFLLNLSIWFLRKRKNKNIYNFSDASIFSYFPNINQDALKNNDFYSNYWGDLHHLIESNTLKINWILDYEVNNNFSLKESINLTKKFMANNKDINLIFLYELISLKLFIYSIYDWFKIIYGSFLVRNIKHDFFINGSKINFWRFLRNDWYDSYFGKHCIENIIKSKIFENYSINIKNQKFALYLWENQSWEKSLCHHWRKNNYDSRIIGVQHATIKKMNLRQFKSSSSKIYETYELNPDYIAVNGKAAYDLLKSKQLNDPSIYKVEALRFLYLSQLKNYIAKKDKNDKSLLVITSYLESEIIEQIKILYLSNTKSKSYRIYIKPHGNTKNISSIIKKHAPGLEYEILNCHIGEALKKSNRVFCANFTSSAVEAAYMGLVVAIMMPQNNFDLSLKENVNNYIPIYDHEDLNRFFKYHKKSTINRDYFYLNNNLTRWKRLLGYLIKK